MKLSQLEIQNLSIVTLGDFTPSIFQPAWFSAKGLVASGESEGATVELINKNIASFRMDWLKLRVTRDRFEAVTAQQPYYGPLRDLVSGTFGLFPNIEVSALGINRVFLYRFESEKAWHALGDRIAPKMDWRAVLKSPGLRQFTMQGERDDGYKGWIWVRIEPAVDTSFNAVIEVNDHYDLEQMLGESSGKISEILSKNWEASMKQAENIVEKLSAISN